MNVQWYGEHIDNADCASVKLESSIERTAAELAHLRRVLAEKAPHARRIADLGCGVGRHAIGLARAGFEVIGLDISEWAIGEARRRSCQAGVEVRWEVVDLLDAGAEWPLPAVDAAISIQAFGWGSDANQRRFLRGIRRHLSRDGVLILHHSGVVCQRMSCSIAHADQAPCRIGTRYDAAIGRSEGRVTVCAEGATDGESTQSVRLYTTPEIAAMLREVGYTVEQVVNICAAQPPPNVEPCSVLIVARPLPAISDCLAVASWRTPARCALDLRYEPDEAEWLDPSPSALWAALLSRAPRLGADAAEYYPVDDPYGAERAAPVIAAHFGCVIPPRCITFGAGVTSLLHDLCRLADGGCVISPQLVHPDLSAWALSHGSEVHLLDEPATPARLIAAIESGHPTLIHLDRPTFAGELIMLAELEDLARAASRFGSILLIDESAANYLGPVGSAVTLTSRLDNLVVLRNLTKAYSWGGLRVGYAVASEGVAGRVRDLVAPMQVGELAFRAVLQLLRAGDVFHRLRERIRVAKPAAIAVLEAAGFQVIAGHRSIPWVLVTDAHGKSSEMLAKRGIQGLRPAASPAQRGTSPDLLHLSIPLSTERMVLFRKLLASAAE